MSIEAAIFGLLLGHMGGALLWSILAEILPGDDGMQL